MWTNHERIRWIKNKTYSHLKDNNNENKKKQKAQKGVS